MKGWKTWVGVAGFIIVAAYHVLNNDLAQALEFFALAMGLLGIGHKIEKIGGQ